MKAWLLFLPFFFGFAGLAQSPKRINCKISGTIPVLKQPKAMDCWITVTTMMLSWKEGRTYTVNQVAKRMGDPWGIYYMTNAGLSEKDQANFIRRVGLKEEPPANYTLEAYLDFIEKYGPIWITTGDGFSAHARLLIGIEGGVVMIIQISFSLILQKVKLFGIML